MKFRDFKNKIKAFPVFSSGQFAAFFGNKQTFRNQLNLWQKSGLIIKIKKSLYVLNESDREINISRSFLANQLLTPSYISLEFALSYYDIIPEKVEDLTSVTSKKTAVYKNAFGVFRYQHIKNTCFAGFREITDENNMKIFIAQPEKAIIDFLYLNLSKINISDTDVFEQNFRFQGLEILNKKKLTAWAELFNNKKLLKVVKNLCAII